MTLATPLLPTGPEASGIDRALAAGAPRVACLCHPFVRPPDNLETADERATNALFAAIDRAADLGARSIYLVTGSRGGLAWEAAATRLADLVAPCLATARAKGVTLLVETASALNAHIHIAHTLEDTIALAQIAHLELCIDLQACWFEGNLKRRLQSAVPMTGLVQVSDYVLGDRTAPCRAVPGDGCIPLGEILYDILEAGYDGLFDLELCGPRIETEGARAATKRAAEGLSAQLSKLGA